MAVNHYSADSAPRCRPASHLRSPSGGNKIPLGITHFPLSRPVMELTTPPSSIYMLADHAGTYVGHAGCRRRLTERSAIQAKPDLPGTSPTNTFND